MPCSSPFSAMFKPHLHRHGLPPIQADSQIRIFSFVSEPKADTIRVYIEVVQLNKVPDYTCISYTWGDPKVTRMVQYGHGTIDVTINLWRALIRIQEVGLGTRQKTKFWADQICIDQKRSKEKEEQVPLMAELFPKAQRVICWLGEEVGSTAEAFAMLRAWSRADANKERRRELARELARIVDTNAYSTDSGCRAMQEFFSRPWFRRVWMLQEIYVSKDKPPVVLCGSHKISWNDLSEAFGRLDSNLAGSRAARVLGENARYVLAMLELYSSDRQNGDFRLSTLLQRTAHREATDPRDRVYAVLGIAARSGYKYPKPGYGDEDTEERVLAKYTRLIIEQEKSLDILSMRKLSSASLLTPSWVFDRRKIEDTRNMLLDRQTMKAYTSGGAAGRTKPLLLRYDRRTDSCLLLAGFVADNIRAVVDLKDTVNRLFNARARWTNVLDEGHRLASRLQLEHHPWAAKAVLRTLALNDFWIACPQPRKDYYLEHLKFQSIAPRRRDTNQGAERELVRLAQREFSFQEGGVSHVLEHNKTTELAGILSWLDKYATGLFGSLVVVNSSNMALAVTCRGRVALVPSMSQAGDDTVILDGGFYPFILRHVESRRGYQLLGPSFVDGLMDGGAQAAASGPQSGSISERREFCLS